MPRSRRTTKTSIREAKQDVAWDFNRGFIDVYPPHPLVESALHPDGDAQTSPPGNNGLSDAVSDLSNGDGFVDRATRVTTVYKRNAKIREQVITEADGCCEVCGPASPPGFVASSGRRYLETHHIIALADQGDDALSNVIAVCANHHREAHFGQQADELENEMLEIVEKREAERARQA